ncbi:MAG: tetratricopeptide repeat family protein, partial [Myxococcaceae bacterium]|nr:tetratricopeptide repeat family protein [Myxococcaceae bacterium]
MPTRIHLVALLLLASCTTPIRRPPGPITQPAPAPVEPAPAPARKAPPKLEGLGPHQRPVSHASSEAQLWFDQGLNLAYGFNPDAAIRSFAYAAELSPDCAMCFWGVAYANGPHLNNPQVNSRAA